MGGTGDSPASVGLAEVVPVPPGHWPGAKSQQPNEKWGNRREAIFRERGRLDQCH